MPSPANGGWKLPPKKSETSAVIESTVEKSFVREVKKLGGRCLKFTGYRGWPDRLVLWKNGKVDWVELKRPKGGRFEPLQKRTHQMLRRMGYDVHVILNKQGIMEYVNRVQLWQSTLRTISAGRRPRQSSETIV